MNKEDLKWLLNELLNDTLRFDLGDMITLIKRMTKCLY